MKNADMPAMPQAATESGHACYYTGYSGTGVPTGLTKREMMAMHMMASLMAVIGYQTREHMAQDAIASTDALLAELEKQQ